MEILTLDSVLRKVLSIGNKEQNQHYPPSVFTQHFNIVTNVLLNELCQNYPKTQDYIDLLSPFIDRVPTPVVNGEAKFSKDYRRLLNVSVFVADKNGGLVPCNKDGEFDGDPTEKSKSQKDKEKSNGVCSTKEAEMLSTGEWSNRTSHSYKLPKLDRPIGCQFGADTIKVCPYDVVELDIRYVRNPKEYLYGYVELPDGTYQFDLSKSVQSEWGINATEYIVNGVATLYTIYVKDGEREVGMKHIKQLLF